MFNGAIDDHTLLAYSNLGLTRVQYNNFLVAKSVMPLLILLMRPSVLLAFAAMFSMCMNHGYDTKVRDMRNLFELLPSKIVGCWISFQFLFGEVHNLTFRRIEFHFHIKAPCL